MANYNTVITNEGAALLASVIANHGTITFTDLKLSENDYTGQEATLTEGTFDGIFANVSVASSIVDITTIKVSATVHGYNFSGDHNLYALGVIGTDGNTTALIAICTTTNPDVLRDNSSTYAFNINLTVSSTSNITVVGTTAAALYTTDIVDNLTSTATDKPLSANMGRVVADNLAANEESGAKNRNVYPYKDTTKTENGVTFIDNGNGTITVSAASYPYTVPSDTVFVCSYFMDNEFKAGTWTLNGSPVVSDDVYVNYVVHYGGEYLNYLDKGQEVTFTQAVDTKDAALVVILKSGYVLAGALLFKPMLRDARILDNTFVPYAKTNQQLTADKAERSDLATLNLTGSTNSTGSTINAGTYFYLNGSYCKAKTSIANGATFTLNTNYEEVTVGGEINAVNDSISHLKIWHDEVTFEFSNSIAAAINLSTTTSGVVTSDNVVAVLGTPIGTPMTTVQLSGQKTSITAIKPSAVTETVTVSLIIWYE